MASDVQICNLALTMLGQSTISSLTQDAPRAEKCKAVYTMLRDIELAEHNWDFATELKKLVAVDETPAYEFEYVYQLPADFLRPVSADSEYLKYKIVGNKLYANTDEFYLEYIKKVTDPGLFPQEFIDILSARIAKELAWSITNNRTLSFDMAENYKRVRQIARGSESQQGRKRKRTINRMEDARRSCCRSY